MKKEYTDLLDNCSTEEKVFEVINSFSSDTGRWFAEKEDKYVMRVYHHFYEDGKWFEETKLVYLADPTELDEDYKDYHKWCEDKKLVYMPEYFSDPNELYDDYTPAAKQEDDDLI